MCGRYTLAKTISSIVTHFNSKTNEQDFKERYNIAPFQTVSVVIQEGYDRVIFFYDGD